MNIIKTNRRALQSGTTLVELSVVIAVILLLVSVLFIAVDGWQKAAQRSACIVNLATLQKMVRSYQNTNIDNPNVLGYDLAALTSAGYFGTNGNPPVCPLQQKAATPAPYAATIATNTGGFPATGSAAFQCPSTSANPAHTPGTTANW